MAYSNNGFTKLGHLKALAQQSLLKIAEVVTVITEALEEAAENVSDLFTKSADQESAARISLWSDYQAHTRMEAEIAGELHTVTLTNSAKRPFNSTLDHPVTVALTNPRKTLYYTVETEVTAHTGLVGEDTGANSTAWRAINAAATAYSNLYMEPNGQGTTAGSVKLDMVDSHWQWGTTIEDAQDSSRNSPFANTTYAETLSDFCKMYLRAMALGPDAEDTNYGGDYFWANNAAEERCAYRGGYWNSGASSGVFALSFDRPRSGVYAHVGGRPAFYD